MLDVLVDNIQNVYLIFGIAALALAAMWWRTARATYLIAAGAAAAVVALGVVLSLLVMTDRKQLVANVHDVVGRMNRGDLDGAFRRFADSVEVKWGQGAPAFPISRDGLRKMAEDARRLPGAGKFAVWAVEVEKVEGPRAVVSFYIRPEDGGGRYAVCKARCDRVGHLDWRVSGLDLEFPGGATPPVAIPPR